MPDTCSAVFCTNRRTRGSELSFHCFPKDKELSKKWETQMRRDKWQPAKRSRLCSIHFLPSCFTVINGRHLLKEGSIPTEFQFEKHLQEKLPDSSPASLARKRPCHDTTCVPSLSSEHIPDPETQEPVCQQRASRNIRKKGRGKQPVKTSISKIQVIKSEPSDDSSAEEGSCTSSNELPASATNPEPCTEFSLPVTGTELLTSTESATEHAPMYLVVSPTERIPLVPFTTTLNGSFMPPVSIGTVPTSIPTNVLPNFCLNCNCMNCRSVRQPTTEKTNVPSNFCLNCKCMNCRSALKPTTETNLVKLVDENYTLKKDLNELQIKYNRKCTENETLRKKLKTAYQNLRRMSEKFSGLAKIIVSLEEVDEEKED